MNDPRTSFDEALSRFREFLRSQDWADSLLWVTRDRITAHRTTYWVYRPDELSSDAASRSFYEVALRTPSSIRLDALGRTRTHSVCYVRDWGGDSRSLNFGIHQPPTTMRVVHNSVAWALLCSLNKLRGEAPFLKDTEIPKNAEQPAAQVQSEGAPSD